MVETFHAGFIVHNTPRALYERAITTPCGPWEAALAYSRTLPDSDKSQGTVVLHRETDGAIFAYRCSTSYVREHTVVVPEKVTRTLREPA